MFPSPTYAGEEVTVQVEVRQVWPDEGLADLTTLVIRPGGALGLQGRTLVRLPGYPSWPARHGGPSTAAAEPPASHPPAILAFGAFGLGQTASMRRTFTSEDLAEYADLAGDTNPLFSDPVFARQLGLAAPPIPGGLLGGLFSYLLGTELPGRGTNYLKQTLGFSIPVYPAEELVASVEIVRLRPEKHLVNLRTLVRTGSATAAGGSTAICSGEALVLVSGVEPSAETTRT
jgi:acyl dehydratase